MAYTKNIKQHNSFQHW